MIEEKTNIDRMRSVAIEQYGYITAAQARDLGVSKAALSMLLKRERVSRVAYGVYRIPQVPATERGRFMLATLWTGADEAALSHETALDAYGVCDVNPGQVHITVAKRRRIARGGGEGYAVHREDLAPEDLSWWEGIPTVTLRKAIAQCTDAGTPSYLLHQAIENGLARGMLLPDEAADLQTKLAERDGG